MLTFGQGLASASSFASDHLDCVLTKMVSFPCRQAPLARSSWLA